MAGQYIAGEVSRFSMVASKSDPKLALFEQFGRQIRHEFPPCEGCKNLKVSEQPNYVRDSTTFQISCTQGRAEAGAMLRCPDGFQGVFDMTEKKWKEIAMRPPFSLSDPKWFEREYLTIPYDHAADAASYTATAATSTSPALTIEDIMKAKAMIETEMPGISKISAGLAAFGPGSTTGYTQADAKINPQIPTDREYVPTKKSNKDVPVTADGDAW